jgi:hypothetical protein
VKVLILYRPNSEHERDVETFAREFQREHNVGKKLELLSMNTRDGAATASIYDIFQFPAVMALADDGSVLQSWVGTPLPLMNDVAGYIPH